MALDSDERIAIRWGAGFVIFVCVAMAVFGAFDLTCGVAHRAVKEAENVAQEEFGARGLLEMYRYFKRVAASLDAKTADIEVMDKRIISQRILYGSDASKWPRDVREAVAQDADALYGLKASYNALAAEYNTSMSDETKRFMNRGEWPRGWPDEERKKLPREYVEYRVK